ncbi:phage head-tail connector protein [Clostridium sp. UBA5988]|uniref:phage head-tail connector protein n=1 Tax=Clostridium sp. UBA5988 TaxID=1946369 RepID=UPI003216AAE9
MDELELIEFKSNIIRDIKVLLDIVDISKDNILNIYINSAYDVIHSYCNYNEDEILSNKLSVAVLNLALLNYRSKGKENVTQESQGSRSRTYKTVGTYVSQLPSEIEVLCKPYRKIKVMR